LRTLRKLERRKLVEPYRSQISQRAMGWGATAEGLARLGSIERWLSTVDESIDRRQTFGRRIVEAATEVLRELRWSVPSRREDWPRPFGLIAPPRPPKTPEWDL
jgi:hypothetical protein